MSLAISATAFLSTLGVNTHFDFQNYGYQNVATAVASIRYLGVTNLRDSAQTPLDFTLWKQVADATGAKFDDYIASTSPADMAMNLSLMPTLAAQGILNYIEGGNEEDGAYAASLGNTLAITAQFQQQVYAMGQQLRLPVINMSFGAGWTADNNWAGNYDKVGDLSAYTDYANAHTYPNVGQGTGWSIDRLNGLARMAAASRPVITTEIGWDENQGFSQADIAKFTLQAAFDGIKYGDVKTYFYALYNDGSGKFGLMNQDGTAKPAGRALHNLTTLLKDTGTGAATFKPGSLNYTLSTKDDTVLMEKSDGTWWLSVWNEGSAAHSTTLKLPSSASQIKLFNPLTGTSAVQSVSNAGSYTFTVSPSPVIVEIVGVPASSTTGSTTGGTTGGTTSPNPVVTVPGSQTVVQGGTLRISGVSVSDPWAAITPGTLALNVVATVGTVSMKDAAGNLVAGSGTGAIHVNGTLAQINADLANLSYTAGSTNGSVSIDVWDQAGVEATRSIGVTVTAPIVITIDPTASIVELSISNATIVATSGNHTIFIGGTNNVVTATGGTENIQAYVGTNRITTGANNDTIRFGGSGNVINAGAGNNVLFESGSNNVIVLPAANKGFDDIFGSVLSNGDKLDLRPLLAATAWKGDLASISKFLKLSTSSNSAVISVDPDGVAGGSVYTVAKLEGSGAISLNTLLAHSITA